MAYGAQVWDETGQSWVDVIQPSWVLDFRSGMSGSGTLSYSLDTAIFHLKVVVLNYTANMGEAAPSFTISGGSINYSLPAGCTFLVVMEAN